MEENLRQQFENTFQNTTCRRSPRLFEKTVKETPATVQRPVLTERNAINSNKILSETLGIGGSPEGKCSNNFIRLKILLISNY